MIQGFASKDTERFVCEAVCPAQWRPFKDVLARKLAYLDAAGEVADLRVPPGNRLEKLTGDRKGQWSIRVNDQWRICFMWTDSGPDQVEVVDYH